MKKIILFGLVAFTITACETMDSVKSGFSESYASVSNFFSPQRVAPCPQFRVSDDLDDYYDLPGTDAPLNTAELSSAKIENIKGACRLNDQSDIITVSMDIDFTAKSSSSNTPEKLTKTSLDIPYFIAVLDADQQIIVKDTFVMPIELSGAEMDTYRTERLQHNLPYNKEDNPANYTVIAGFQLDPSQLAFAQIQDNVANVKPAAGTPAVNLDAIPAADPFAGR